MIIDATPMEYMNDIDRKKNPMEGILISTSDRPWRSFTRGLQEKFMENGIER